MTQRATLTPALLGTHPFLSGLESSSLRRLANHVAREDLAENQPIFVEGGAANRFFLIRRGLVKLDMSVPGRGRVDVETLSDGAAFGWSWLLPPYRWHFSATALRPTDVLVVDATMLRSLMSADPVLGYELMRRFAALMFDRFEAARAHLDGSAVGASGTPSGVEDITLPTASVSGPWAGQRVTGGAQRISRGA